MQSLDQSPVRSRRGGSLRPLAVAALGGLVALAWSWHPSLWTDEAATISAARRSLGELWHMVHTIDAVHGLYYAGMHLWVALAGSSALALRLPSALATGLGAGALMVLVRRIGVPEPSPTICAVVFCLLPRTTWMGTEARSYAFTVLVAILLTLLLVTAVTAVTSVTPVTAPATTTSGRWVGYALLGAVGIVLNLYLALLLVAHGASLVLRRTDRADLARWLAASTTAVLIASPVVLLAAGQSGQLGDQSLGPVRLLRSIMVNQAFLGDTPTTSNVASTSLSLSGVADLWQPAAVLLATVAVLVIGVGAARSWSGAGELYGWALPWALLPPLLVGGYAMLGPPLYNPRYFTFCTPAVAILVGLGLEALRRRWLMVTAAALMVVLAAPVYASQRRVSAKSGSDWVQVADFVAARKAPGEAVYFAPRYETPGPTVGRTLRSIRIAYPGQFAGLRDLTELSTPVGAGDLVGTSSRLAASGARLAGVRVVWVIRRSDYPAARAADDDAFLQRAGFQVVMTRKGGLTTVEQFRRG